MKHNPNQIDFFLNLVYKTLMFRLRNLIAKVQQREVIVFCPRPGV